MNIDDFQGINRFKWLMVGLVLLVFILNISGCLCYEQSYQNFFINFQKMYMIRMAYLGLMNTLAMIQAWKIIKKVELKEEYHMPSNKIIYHAIVIPIYQESIELVRETLDFLSQHSRAKKQYLIFLALEKRSNKPEEFGFLIKQQFKSKFKLIHSTIHPLIQGEAAGKHSNQNYCLLHMEDVLIDSSINPADVLFTTLDADNWMHEIYFSEVQLYLSKHDWNLDRYMFAPNQMFTRNNLNVPMINRAADYIMGAVIFGWSNNITQCQNAASNYSISFNSIKKYDFFDTNADGMCDDYHNSMRIIWKSQGYMRIIPIFMMSNMVSLQTNKGYFADIYARFWQAERHMRMFLDAAYNFNMLVKNPFNWRTFWTTLAYFQNHFISLGLYLTGFIYVISKLSMGRQFNETELFIFNFEAVIFTIVMLNYFIITSKSSKILYNQSYQSWWRLLEIIIFGKLFLLLMAIIPQIVATIRIAMRPMTYETAAKNVSLSKSE